MSSRRHYHFSNRRRIIRCLAAASVWTCATVVAQAPAEPPTTELKIVASQLARPAESAPPVSESVRDTSISSELKPFNGVQLNPPGNSTLEIRVARRPWLLEKLSGKRTEPSQKMNPPRPPADLPDPPSMSRIVPELRAPVGQTPASRSVPLHDPKQSPTYADVPEQANQKESVEPNKQNPQTDSVVETDPAVESDQVVLGPAAPPQLEVNQADADQQSVASSKPSSEPSEPKSDDAKVSVRDLSIQPDGTPTDESDSKPTRVSKKDRAVAAEPTKEDQGSQKSDQKSQYVGDIDESESVAAEPIETPSVPLDYTGHPQQQIRLTRSVLRMRGMMQQCLRYYHMRPEIANRRSNWGMMHSIMVYGIDTQVIVGRKKYSAIAWIAGNNACRGQKVLAERNGSLVATSGVGLQGHPGQLLAVFSLAGVPDNYTLYAGETKYNVQDLIKAEQLACKKGEELTFTLIGLAHYLDTDATWKNAAGERWNFEKLVREELSQPIVGAACGGTHRLMGFGHALRARRAEGRPITGQWKRAEQYVQSFVRYTYRLQNRDGSMSTDWFEGREDNGELDRKIQTTGHMVEWLLTVTPDSELQNPRLVAAVRFLLRSMYEERDKEWEIGPKGHALRSLAMYYERVYQNGPAWRVQAIAGRNSRRQR